MLKDKITKEMFFEYLNGLRHNSQMIDAIYKATNGAFDIINFEDELCRPYHLIEKCFFTHIELDIIGWYLYENVEKKIYNSETHEVIADLIDDEALWEYLNRE